MARLFRAARQKFVQLVLAIVLLVPLGRGKWRKGGPRYPKREERRGLAQKFNEDEQVLSRGMVRIQRVEAPGAGQCAGLDEMVVVTGLGTANWQLRLGQNRVQAR